MTNRRFQSAFSSSVGVAVIAAMTMCPRSASAIEPWNPIAKTWIVDDRVPTIEYRREELLSIPLGFGTPGIPFFEMVRQMPYPNIHDFSRTRSEVVSQTDVVWRVTNEGLFVIATSGPRSKDRRIFAFDKQGHLLRSGTHQESALASVDLDDDGTLIVFPGIAKNYRLNAGGQVEGVAMRRRELPPPSAVLLHPGGTSERISYNDIPPREYWRLVSDLPTSDRRRSPVWRHHGLLLGGRTLSMDRKQKHMPPMLEGDVLFCDQVRLISCDVRESCFSLATAAETSTPSDAPRYDLSSRYGAYVTGGRPVGCAADAGYFVEAGISSEAWTGGPFGDPARTTHLLILALDHSGKPTGKHIFAVGGKGDFGGDTWVDRLGQLYTVSTVDGITVTKYVPFQRPTPSVGNEK